MRAFSGVVGFILSVLTASLVLGQEEPDWDQAEQNIKRLPASRFESLPASLRAELERRGCTIPQTSDVFGSSSQGNVISGHFLSSGQTDLAVLCSRDGVSSILVFPAGRADSIAELAAAPDRAYLQVMLPGQISFSRQISVATPQAIERSQQNYGGEVPFPLSHDGIEDIFQGKGSNIWYWHETEWHQLRGAD